ncbi:MAG: fasciclin domain-containing protein [Chloroflexi bacterium]|nr:fasciclin domain-containing protein [Chloroflexota bacterium]
MAFSGKFFLLTLALLIVAGAVGAQSDEPAMLRVMQLSYVLHVSATIDIRVDEAVIFEGIGFPFATDYVELAPGDHTLTTMIADQRDATATVPIALEPGHRYSVVIEGDYTDGVTFVTVDETALLAEGGGSSAIIVNLSGQPISDIAVDGEAALESVGPDSYGLLPLPAKEVVISGKVGDQTYSETFTPHSNTEFLIAVRQMPSGEPQITYHRSSPLTIAEYLRSIGQGAQFSGIVGHVGGTDLLESLTDEGQYTLFLPTNDVLSRLTIPSDGGVVRDLLLGHVIPQRLPPYDLPDHQSLTTLAGNMVSLDFSETASGYWEIGGVPILWDVRLANGVIYAIDGIVAP